MPQPLIIIPARMASTRLPNKPLADIAGLPMIVQVLKRAQESGIGRVIVAAGEQEIIDVVEAHGGQAVLTDPDLPSGSDRIHQALTLIDAPRAHELIVNLQGDLPTLDPSLIGAVAALVTGDVDMATLVAEMTDRAEFDDPNCVKAVIAWNKEDKEAHQGEKARTGRALYFTRATAPYGAGARYHHIGIYAYTRAALDRFVALKPSPLEQREKLEQLRALEDDMKIAVAQVDTVPLGVDTLADLESARKQLGEKT